MLVERAARLAAAVTGHAAANPLEPGMPVETARQIAGMPDARLVELLLGTGLTDSGLTDSGLTGSGLTVANGRVHAGRPATGSVSGLPTAVRGAVAEVRAELAQHAFAAPEARRLTELGLGPKQLAAAVRAGELLKIADGIYLAPGADDDATERLRGLRSPFTLSQARQALNTTRRVAVPIMELLARRGITRQLPNGMHEMRS